MGTITLKIKDNFAYSKPEIKFSTEILKSFVGMGDIEMNLDLEEFISLLESWKAVLFHVWISHGRGITTENCGAT